MQLNLPKDVEMIETGIKWIVSVHLLLYDQEMCVFR